MGNHSSPCRDGKSDRTRNTETEGGARRVANAKIRLERHEVTENQSGPPAFARQMDLGKTTAGSTYSEDLMREKSRVVNTFRVLSIANICETESSTPYKWIDVTPSTSVRSRLW